MPGKLSAVASRPQDQVEENTVELDLEDAPPVASSAETMTSDESELDFGQRRDEIVAKLLEPLDNDLVKKRKGFGRDENGNQNMLRYLEWHTVTKQLNRIFGFGNWSTEVIAVEDFYDHAANDGIPRAVRVTKQLTVNHPFYSRQTFIGYSPVQPNRDGKHTWEAYEMAVGNAEATAFKRGAAQFGEQFGLSLYEKLETATGASSETTANSSASSNSQSSAASDEATCEVCGKEIRGYTAKSGATYTTADLLKFSKRDTGGHVLCYDHKREWQQEHQGRA